MLPPGPAAGSKVVSVGGGKGVNALRLLSESCKPRSGSAEHNACGCGPPYGVGGVASTARQRAAHHALIAALGPHRHGVVLTRGRPVSGPAES